MEPPIPPPPDRWPSPGPSPDPSPDGRLARRIAESLAGHDAFRRQPVAIQVQNRVAILTGSVESPEIYDALALHVRQTPGVTDLCDGLLIADGEARLRAARQFGELAAHLAVAPPHRPIRRRTRVGAVLLALPVTVVLIEIAGWLAILFAIGLLALAADLLLRRRRR
ncbi:BON domain-containing protein [Actinoplanes solisilvae]|uniref:BON domain-containing protein n=1 Tax=Actinoplanes solisilvae TaxID=2486853 RepID=UPI0013E35DCD|nr:BON domain-containing protein [Actinoplanes solisilvae]